MITVYRLLRRPYADAPFDGEGSYRYGGRWSSVGTRIAYASEHLSLAMIEYFVHIPIAQPPQDLVVAAAAIPDRVRRVMVRPSSLPRDWRRTPAPHELAALGDAFAKEGKYAVAMVPSALSPGEHNVLINPRHADFKRIRLFAPVPFAYDPRFFRRT